MFGVTSVGELKPDGTKMITVYDKKDHIVRNIKVDAKEADTFVACRKEALEKASKKDSLFQIGSVVLGTLAGLCVGLKGKKPANYVKGESTFIGFAVGSVVALLKAMSPGTLKADKKITEEFITNNVNNIVE